MDDVSVLFTSAFLEDLKRRYSSMPNYDQPLIYRVATSDELNDVRGELEAWLGELPSRSLPQLVGNLKGTDQTFIEAYHELAVGALLSSLGLQPRYEVSFANLKPDWSTCGTAAIPPLIVEVLTLNEPNSFRQTQSALSELYFRLKKIQFPGVVLMVRFNSRDHCLSRNLVAQTANSVQRWLLERSPETGAELRVNKLFFKVVKRDDNPKLRCWLPAECFYANTQRLEKAIQKKVQKYKGVALEHHAAFLIAVAASPVMGLDLNHLCDVLVGSWVVNTTRKEATDGIPEGSTAWIPGGLFARSNRTLSGVLWVWRDFTRWRIQVVLNPQATNSIPDGVFPTVA